MEEGELIRRMKRGDPAALEALMDRDMAFACGVASSILRDAPRDVEEIVSDSFLALWNNAHKLVPGRVRGYLGAIVRNRAKNRLRELGKELPLDWGLPIFWSRRSGRHWWHSCWTPCPFRIGPSSCATITTVRRWLRSALPWLSTLPPSRYASTGGVKS